MIKLLLLIFISSCSFFVGKIDTPLVNSETVKSNIPAIKTFCENETNKFSLQLVSSNHSAQSTYQQFVWNKYNNKLDIFDHFALWSLMQLTVRPDQSSPTSRLQILFHHQGQSKYFDFYSETNDDQFPYLYAIEWVLKKFGKKTNLEYYASILHSLPTNKLTIDQDFESFLTKNIEAIRNNPDLMSYYLRGNEILQEDESPPTIDYHKIISLFRKAQKNQSITITTTLTPFKTKNGDQGSCNYDFNLYDNSIFLIDKVIPVANIFGLSLKDEAFLATSSQKIEPLTALGNSSLIKGNSKVRSSAVCVIENENSKIWTVSNNSRDPGQHLFHLLRYGLTSTTKFSEVDKLIRHSRHLFLSDPVRLIIESERSDPEQVGNLLKLNLPIYNADKLGNIWSYVSLNHDNRFIIDDRNTGTFLCK